MCKDGYHEVTVNDKVTFNPGISTTITICKKETPTEENLFNALQGNPDEGGMWTNEGNIYIYTIGSNMPCSQVASSTITVIKDNNAPLVILIMMELLMKMRACLEQILIIRTQIMII
ncbi:hypothetical protein [Balneicella halophila]|uniref:hypothetical protein n=1 Tax=Balneicella halophila TaxID=1537566 RepID=UPI000E306EA7|nr:hypothetical protein [Balneicella halophila]